MNYSSYHKVFAIHLNFFHDINEQDVLEHPENYLGPNYKEVLNWWFYWDSLSEDQIGIYWKRWDELDNETREKARKTSRELASEVIDPRFVWGLWPLHLEVVAAHLYIERGITFTYLPLIFDL